MKLQNSFKFVNAIRLANKLSKTVSKSTVQKLRNMNLFMSYAFFHYFFSNLIEAKTAWHAAKNIIISLHFVTLTVENKVHFFVPHRIFCTVRLVY